MGIDLGDLVVKRPTTLEALAGRRIAIDAWNILYQFLSNIRQPDGTPLKAPDGTVTSHLAGILYRTSNLVEAGIKPVWVFDGEPHPLKRETLAGRALRREAAEADYAQAVEEGDLERALSKAKQTSRMTSEMALQARELLQALGVPVVDAPGEGEAQSAWMCAKGLVDASCSQDFDSLLFGAPELLRNLTTTGRRKVPGKQVWTQVAPETIRLDESLQAVGLTREQLVDAALLVGTDFNPGIKGIGPKKAVALVKKEGSLEALVERLGSDPASADTAVERALLEQHEALAERDAVRRIFLEPAHVKDVEVHLAPADPEAVHAIMVERFAFSPERVDGALKKFTSARGRQAQKGLFDF